MYAIKRFVLLILIVVITPLNTAFAQEVKSLNIGDWRMIVGKEGGENQCYAYTTPFRTKAFEADERQEPYMILVSKSPKEVSIGINSGFIVDKKKGFTVAVNDRTHLLDNKLIQNSWTSSAYQDVVILDDMIKDDNFVKVRSYDTKDNLAVDYYSLKGFQTIYNLLMTNCKSIQKSS